MVLAEHRATSQRMPLECLYNGVLKDMGDTVFEKFVMMHVIIGSSDLKPTIMTIYQDDTFELDTFHSDIKTTVYRKINETANKIANEDIKEVFWMQTYLAYPSFSYKLIVPAKDRAKLAEKAFLTFMKVDNALNEEEMVFDGENIKCMNYIVNQLKHSDKKKLNFGKNNMMPIMKAFKAKLEVSRSTESV
jgi:hypothetical protein